MGLVVQWHVGRPGIKPVSLALAGIFLTTGLPGKSLFLYFWCNYKWNGWPLFQIVHCCIKTQLREFPGGPVVRTLCFHPWLGNEDPACKLCVAAKNKKTTQLIFVCWFHIVQLFWTYLVSFFDVEFSVFSVYKIMSSANSDTTILSNLDAISFFLSNCPH